MTGAAQKPQGREGGGVSGAWREKRYFEEKSNHPKEMPQKVTPKMKERRLSYVRRSEEKEERRTTHFPG